MLQDNLHAPFQVVLKEQLDECHRPEHKHSFFELVYIVSGTGLHGINQSTFAYKPNHLFLLAPDDSHYFNIGTPTQFLFIRFNPIYLKTGQQSADMAQRLAFILKNAGQAPGCVLTDEGDKAMLKHLAGGMLREYASHGPYNDALLHQYVHTLLVIVARNLGKSLPENIHENTEARTLDILQYIQQNITSPEKIRAADLSKHFGISETYLGRYFKKHTSETMQQYISNYKMELVAHRLQHSDKRIVEIADEFGFTDKSHLNRMFKKYKGVSPSEFKKALHQPGGNAGTAA